MEKAIKFTKAHGCGNDFLIVEGWPHPDPAALAIAICDRHTGVGADGLYFLDDHTVHLYNSDGSPARLSGNGTRCVAAKLAAAGEGPVIRIETGAGPRELRLTSRTGDVFHFAMNLGHVSTTSGPEGSFDVAIGNPQCISLVDSFDFDWKRRGAELECHPHYPDRTNVEFVRVIDPHRIEIRIWERGAGWTLSSGTGATASAVAAVHAGQADYPVTVVTEGGELSVVESEGGEIVLNGPAELIADGLFYSSD
jgi:diaminopimelate epimerase